MSAAPIDIIVPVYRSAALTGQCLQSLMMNLGEIAAHAPRLVVINDSPDDPEVEAMLASFVSAHSGLTLLRNATNEGFIRSVNRGLDFARSESRDVILVNADTRTYPGTLAALIEAAYSDPQIGFVSPRSNNASLCSLPHLPAESSCSPDEALARWKLLSRTLPAQHFLPTAVGFYLYIKHTVLANFAPLDTQFGAGYEEENDLILRASKVGYRAVLANHAFAFHAGSASFSLTDLNLAQHRERNLRMMMQRHPEFLPLIRRYEGSAHFRAESLLSGLLPDARGRLGMVFDLSQLGCFVNGTSEQSVATLRSLCARHGASFQISALCTEAVFRYHALDAVAGLRRLDHEPLTPERFAIAVRIGQPFKVGDLSTLERLAPINIFGMLDTIAEDCGYLSLTHPLEDLWGHAARHASGLFFISQFSQATFLGRFAEARKLERYARLLPTRLSEYARPTASRTAEHLLILGNHYAHKASDETAARLQAAFPQVHIVVLGKQTAVTGNLRSYQSGELSDVQMHTLYAQASVVVLPSYVEGFGFGLVHALAMGKAVVARDIAATREILATYASVSGVFLYRDDIELVNAIQSALVAGGSQVHDPDAQGWDEWVDGFVDYCRDLLNADDLFQRTVDRIRAGDILRRAQPPADARTSAPAIRTLGQLLALEDEPFVEAAYVSILGRDADPSGRENYLSELKAGVDKFTIVERLRNSPEGRTKDLPLPGFARVAMTRRLLKPFGRQ